MATTLKDNFLTEFDCKVVSLQIVKQEGGQAGGGGAAAAAGLALSVVLENTGEVLHAVAAGDNKTLTETDVLKMISRVGSWLAKQPKL